MRTISAADEQLLTAVGGRRTLIRVKVKDAGGTFRDLTTYPGENMVLGATWNEDVDSNGLSATITLKREVEKISLSPLMDDSPLNRGFVHTASPTALIAMGREVQIDRAIVADLVEPVSGDWVLAFHGYVDVVKIAEDESLVLECSDLSAKLVKAFVKTERIYAFAQGVSATKGCRVWTPDTSMALTERAVPTEARRNGHFYRITAVTTGITGSTEPSWPTGGGATVVDGGVTWTESGSTSTSAGTAVETIIQQILDDHIGSVTLNVPASPSTDFKWFKQQREKVWEGVRKLAEQLGWDLRYKWDAGSSTFKLTLYEPPRSNTTPDRTFAAFDLDKITQLDLDIADIRNVVRVVYSDSADLDPQGHPKRKTVEVNDSASISALGELFMEVAEASASNIDTSTEADVYANAMLSDLSTPLAQQGVELPFFPFVELGDLYRFSANDRYYSSSQDLAVIGYTHTVDQNGAVTALRCRGKASGGLHRWLRKAAEINPLDVHEVDLANTAGLTITTSDVVGGTKVDITATENKLSLPPHVELHLSTSAGFTPAAASLFKRGADQSSVIPNLVPGKTYYLKVVPYGHNSQRIVRANSPSVEQSFVAGRASAGHLHDGISIGDYPLNGGFETRLDSGSMPDHWIVFAGTYNTHWIVKEDANGISGNRYLRMSAAGSVVQARTGAFPIINESANGPTYGGRYRFSLWYKNDAGNAAGTFNVLVRLLNSAGSEINILTAGSGISATAKLGKWQKLEFFVTVGSADPTARTAQIYLQSSAHTFVVDFDEVRAQYLGTPWYEVGDTSSFTDNYEAIPGFANSWVNYNATTHARAAFRKDRYGRVYLKGLVKDGTIGAAIVNLPAGYRPQRELHHEVSCNGARGELVVQASGAVLANAGNNTYFSMNFSFETWE